MRDFYIRTAPSNDEMNHLIRTGAFDAFGQSRTEQFEARTLLDSIPIRKATD
jgi:hypothetical protein